MNPSEYPLYGSQSDAERVRFMLRWITRRYGNNASASVSGPWDALRPYRASFEYDADLGCHIAICSAWRWRAGHIVRCGNGPLNEAELPGGVCSEGPHIETGHEPPY